MSSKPQMLFRSSLLDEIFSYIYFKKKADINPIFIPIRILTSMNISCKKGFSFTPIIKESSSQSVVNLLDVFSRGLSLFGFPFFYTYT